MVFVSTTNNGVAQASLEHFVVNNSISDMHIISTQSLFAVDFARIGNPSA